MWTKLLLLWNAMMLYQVCNVEINDNLKATKWLAWLFTSYRPWQLCQLHRKLCGVTCWLVRGSYRPPALSGRMAGFSSLTQSLYLEYYRLCVLKFCHAKATGKLCTGFSYGCQMRLPISYLRWVADNEDPSLTRPSIQEHGMPTNMQYWLYVGGFLRVLRCPPPV